MLRTVKRPQKLNLKLSFETQCFHHNVFVNHNEVVSVKFVMDGIDRKYFSAGNSRITKKMARNHFTKEERLRIIVTPTYDD